MWVSDIFIQKSSGAFTTKLTVISAINTHSLCPWVVLDHCQCCLCLKRNEIYPLKEEDSLGNNCDYRDTGGKAGFQHYMYTLVRWRWPRNAGVVTTAYDSVTLLVARQEFIHLTCYSDKQTSGFKDHRTSCEKFVVLLSSEFNSSQTNLSHYHELSITSPFSHHKVLRCPGRHQVTQQPHHKPLL